MRRAPVLVTLLLVISVITGCSADRRSSPTGDTAGSGPITFATGKDTTRYLQPLLDSWNATHPGQEVTLIELPEAADEQRAQLVANLQAQSDRYDVLGLDVMWTAEFAEAGWVIPLSPAAFPLDRFLAPVTGTAMYRGKLYAVPYTSNTGLLYYRSDILAAEGAKPPRTWAELRRLARELAGRHRVGGYAGQFLPYEGLTVNFTEAVQSAGGEILSRDGRTALLTGAAPGLEFLVQGLREGWIPAESLTYKEEESRLAFQEGRLLFARNWPPAYGPATRPDSPVAGKVGIAPLPGLTGPGSGSLGGSNLAVSAFSKRQKSAHEFIRYFTGLENQRRVLVEGSFPPVWAELYDDPALIKRFPYLPTLKQSILSARPRPTSPNYNQISLAIANSVSAVLNGRGSVEETLSTLKHELNEILRTP
ncbi:ABC transporter substrate-binding protein [Rhizohabitans arisaemae]|uniref:ABC transporter substrate-binding protein n=1 Tax=Rhizohabitans arisaemae TaxID=2720610 RepID=UPI0024B072EA|nr:ABC transporter substrate-binding protein [Rhizohabitans arisaemae]